MIAELMNMNDEPRDAILTLTYEYIPSVPSGFDKVKSYWLDIGGCRSSEFPAESNAIFQYSSPPWKSHSAGRITFIASHLHDGGTHIEVKKNCKVICDAKAVYGLCDSGVDSISTNANMMHISSISECTDLGSVQPGDEWSITAYYDTSKHSPMTNMDGSLEPVMGISLIFVAEQAIGAPEPAPHHDHPHHHHRVRNIVLGFSILAGAIVLLTIWARRNGRPIEKVFLRWKQDKPVKGADVNEGLPLFSEEYHDQE